MYLLFLHRCLIRWTKGAPGYEHKWSPREIKQINQKLRSYNAFKPKEIHRSVRDLQCISFWKGSEYRSFLLYFSIVVLKSHTPEDEYNNFLRLYCATRICYTDKYKAYIEIAQKWFDNYIEGCVNMYGEHSISSNVHNLTHVVNDVKEFGCLEHISTYPFENMLQSIKLKVKQKNMPLQQITRRLIELSSTIASKPDMNSSAISSSQVKYAYSVNGKQIFREIITDYFILSTRKKSDSWFLTAAGDIVLMIYATIDCENISVHGTILKSKLNYFTFPISSKYLDIYQSDGQTSSDIVEYSLQSIKAKLICLPIDQSYVFIPLLHTLK